jgi:hypothetical protein
LGKIATAHAELTGIRRVDETFGADHHTQVAFSMPRVTLARPATAGSARYLGAVACVAVAAFIAMIFANRAFAPEMYSRAGVIEIARAFASGRNHSVFDLNINIRELREEHIKRMVQTPDVVVLGASHWQEAHDWLIQHKRFYNAHVHRDYYEDMLGMVEMFVRHDRLPKQMIIAIRDNLFTPVSARTDHLWLPGVPYYRAMADRLGLKQHATWETIPWPRWRELTSVSMLYGNVTRRANAVFLPQRTYESDHPSLDILLPGGSIVWSHEHRQMFTRARTTELSDAFARQRVNDPPKIDPKGVAALEALFEYLKQQGVEVYLAHPPFNPEYYDQVMKGPYAEGLRRVEALTVGFAEKYGFSVIGSFDPSKLDCQKHMFIDAEHASSECLHRLFNQFTVLDKAKMPAAPARATDLVAELDAGGVPGYRIALAQSAPLDVADAPVPDYAAPEPVGDETPPLVQAQPVAPPAAPPALVAAPQPSAVSKPVSVAAMRHKPKRPHRLAAGAPALTVDYPFPFSLFVAAPPCARFVWPGDHAFPERLRGTCGYKSSVRGS